MGPPDHDVYMSQPCTARMILHDTILIRSSLDLNQRSMFFSYFVDNFRERRELLPDIQNDNDN
jgi:hypothetical protein